MYVYVCSALHKHHRLPNKNLITWNEKSLLEFLAKLAQVAPQIIEATSIALGGFQEVQG